MVDNTNAKSALEHNIKSKGENSYYYAHAKKFSENGEPVQGKIFEGESLIYGGEPVLVAKIAEAKIEVTKPPTQITQYSVYDNNGCTKVRIQLPDQLLAKIPEDSITCSFEEKSLDLKIIGLNSEVYALTVKRLFAKIVPSESRFRVIRDSLILSLKKVKTEQIWDKLTGSPNSLDDD